MPRQTLQTTYPDIRLLVKDLRSLLASIPDTELVEVQGQYTQGFTLRLARKPRAVELVACVNARAPGTVTGFGQAVEFVWEAAGARVLRIDGLSVGSTPYVFTFRITY